MNWGSRLKFRNIAKVAVAVSVVLAVIFAGFTIYGSQVGNFLVSIDQDDELNLSLFNDEQMSSPQEVLNFDCVKDQTNSTYQTDHGMDITEEIKNIDDGLGDKNDYKGRKYSAFSFLLQNKSKIDADIEMSISIKSVHRDVDKCVRIMLIEDGVRSVYAAPKSDGSIEDFPYKTIPFAGPTEVVAKTYKKVPVNAIKKYTIVAWIEGHDEQCKDNIKGGNVKMQMKFVAKQA